MGIELKNDGVGNPHPLIVPSAVTYFTLHSSDASRDSSSADTAAARQVRGRLH